jgi:hypothetical protein
MVDKLIIRLDFTGAEEADDGNTTHFGGVYCLDGEVFQGWGDDRSDSWHAEAGEKVEAKIQAKWSDFPAWKERTEEEEGKVWEAWKPGMPSPSLESNPLLDISNNLVLEVNKRANLEVVRSKDGKFTAQLKRFSKPKV